MADWPGLEQAHLMGYVHTGAVWDHMDPNTLRKHAKAHGWVRPFRSVVHLGPVVEHPLSHLAAAVVRLGGTRGELVGISGWPGMYLHGLVTSLATTAELTIAHGRRAPEIDGVRIRRSRSLEARHIVMVQGLPTLAIPCLLTEMAGRVSESVLRGWLLDVRQRRQATFAEILAASLEAGPVKGQRLLRRLIAELDDSDADSRFEDLARAKLIAGGYTPDPGQVEVHTPRGVRRIDIPFSPQLVGLECHSMRYHGSREAFERDAVRNRELALTGWTILPMTWHDLHEGWAAFLADLDAALRSR